MNTSQPYSVFISNKSSFLYYLLFFLAGFNNLIVFATLILTCIMISIRTYIKLKLSWEFLGSATIFFLYLILTFFIGYDRFYISKPFNPMIIIIISTIFLGFILQSIPNIEKKKLISLYIIGLATQSLFIVLYNYIQEGNYGYGNLLNPFTGDRINSPSISNNLALSLSLALYYLFNSKKIVRFTSIFFTILILACGIYLSGRTFFFLSLIALTALLVKNLRVKNIAYFLLLIILASLAIIYLLPENLSKHLDFTLSRLNEGIESNRFKHYYYGITTLPDYPFGGFTIDFSIENTLWFHNIFLDTARVAGWIPMFLLILFTIMSLVRYFKIRQDNSAFFGFYIFLITFIIMQQDVILEGEYRILIIFFLSSLMFIPAPKNKTC
ncbi:TPA: hypothetical protein ACS72F_003224 [Providencia alcalifaciens]